MNTDNFLAIVLLITAILTTLSVGFSWFFAKHFCAPKRKQSNKTPTNYDLAYEEVDFTSQGVSLKGWFIPGKGHSSSKATIVIAHGWSNSMVQMLPIAEFLHEEGMNSFLYDARSHGKSSNDNPITLQKFAQDMISAINYLAQRVDVDMNQIGVIGHSMGGSGAIVATSMEPRIQALVSSAAFADPVALTRKYMRLYHIPRGPLFYLTSFFINRWLDTNMADIAPKNRIKQISRPILLLHGELDQKIAPNNLEILKTEAQPQYVKSRLIHSNVTHSTIIFDPEFQAEVVAFFKSHLGTNDSNSNCNNQQIEPTEQQYLVKAMAKPNLGQ